MKTHILTLTLMFAFCGFLSENLMAQQQPQQVKSRKNKINKWVKTADESFKSERYFKAFGYYDRAYQRETEGPMKMHLRERLGETQRRLNNPVESVTHFDAVWENGRRDKDFLMSYGDILLKTANYPKAETVYQMLYRQDTSDIFIKNRLASAQLGLAYADSLDVIFRDQIRSQYKVATPFSQYGMVIVDDKLVYSSAQRVKPALTDQRTGHGFSHLYQATLRQDSLLWENPQPLSFNIWGNVINDGVFTYDHVNKIGYFQRCNEGNCGIYTTTFENGIWTVPQKFEMNGVAASNVVGHPAISPDGKRLIFTTRAEGGEGGSDLWMTTKVDRPATTTTARRRTTGTTGTANPAASGRAATAATRQTEREQAAPPAPAAARAAAARGRAPATPPAVIRNQDWDVPVNLGKAINTKGDEVFPIWINNEAIAFSSNGHVGYGGLDIYVAVADENGHFNEAKHIEAPINSSFDDYTLVISPDIPNIFFSSSRYVGLGHSDEIYSFPKTASILEFQFEVKDNETDMPLADAAVSLCDADTCIDLTTDEFGKASVTRPKTTMSYDVTITRDNYYDSELIHPVNQAFTIIPLRDIRKIAVAMQRDTSQKIEFDPIPARWEFLSQNLEDDVFDVLAIATLDTLAQLLGLNNTCVENLQIELNPSDHFTQVGELRALDAPMVGEVPIDETTTCNIYYHEKEAFFSTQILAHTSGEFQITGMLTYTVGRPDSTFVFRDVPFSVLVVGKEKPIVDIDTSTPEQPPLLALSEEPKEDEQPPVESLVEEEPIVEETPQIIEEIPIQEPEEEIDMSWAEGVEHIENPMFSHKMSLHECDSINLMAECMRPGMTPEQIIRCIESRKRECEGFVDARYTDEYKDRINDPNRRANLTILPPGTPCQDCDKTPQRHNKNQPLYIQATDDKQALRFTDHAGNVTFFDLAPNTRYEINVQSLVTDGVASLPDNIRSSDIVKTVTTKDYVIFECVPKLSEVGDEIYVNNIYFDFDQSDIIKDGHRELDRLIIIAIKNPQMRFEITSHADERGSVAYNQELTERRLNSVLDYIRRKGMDASRLITRAASNLEPLIKGAKTDEEHALNRRTNIRLYDPSATNQIGRSYDVNESSPLNKKGLWFRVQIAAYKEAPEYPLYLFSDYIRAAQGAELVYYQDRDGLYKFTLGEFSDLSQARRLNQRILDANKEAYVVAFMDGQRITVAEAQAIIRRQAGR